MRGFESDWYRQKVNGALDPQIARHARPKAGSERKFGLTFAAVFVALGLWPLTKGHEIRIWAVVIALFFLAVSLAAPRLLARPNRLWFDLGILLGRVTSPVVLGLMFFVVVTPMALLMRALGQDPLRLRRRDSYSYLVERKTPGPNAETLKNQF